MRIIIDSGIRFGVWILEVESGARAFHRRDGGWHTVRRSLALHTSLSLA